MICSCKQLFQSKIKLISFCSFYEPSTFGPNLNNSQLGTEALNQEDVDLVHSVLGVQDGWEPQEDIFGLLEEMILFEEQVGECNLRDQPNGIGCLVIIYLLHYKLKYYNHNLLILRSTRFSYLPS